MNTWSEISCPKCGKTNWFNNGDTNDLTVGDIEAGECWSCNHRWFFMDDDEAEMSGVTLEDCLCEKGLERP